MSTFEAAIHDFGRDVGIEQLATGATGMMQFRFENSGTLGFAQLDDELVLHWMEPAPYDAPALLLRALKRLASPEPSEPAVQVGLRGEEGVDHLVFATRMREQGCTGRELRRMVDWVRGYAGSLRA